MHTSRSPKSADRPDGLAYNKSQAGREALPLCSQLGAYHTGSMGPTIHNRVSVRTYPNPTPGQPTPGDLVFKGGAQQNITGDLRTPGQRCYCGSPANHRQLHIPDLSGGKERGGQRPFINLKGLNSFVKTEHFKMEGLHVLPDLIQQGDWMIKLDLKDAYLQLPIHKEYQCLLQFYWEQKTYQFVCLPFGLTSALRVFTKIMKPVVGKLRQMGIRLIVYLDDILIMHQIREKILQITPLVCQIFEALGLMVNMEKSLLVPQQELEFLGFLVNSVSLHLAFPTEKMRKIQQNARTLMYQQQVSIRDIARFVGKASASARAIWQAPLHYRALQYMMNSVAPMDQSLATRMTKFSVNLNLTEGAKMDLSWWISLNRDSMTVSPLVPLTPDITIK